MAEVSKNCANAEYNISLVLLITNKTKFNICKNAVKFFSFFSSLEGFVSNEYSADPRTLRCKNTPCNGVFFIFLFTEAPCGGVFVSPFARILRFANPPSFFSPRSIRAAEYLLQKRNGVFEVTNTCEYPTLINNVFYKFPTRGVA